LLPQLQIAKTHNANNKAQVLWSFEQSAGREIRVLGDNKRRADSKTPHKDTTIIHRYTMRDSRMHRDRNIIFDQRQIDMAVAYTPDVLEIQCK
jgi:hypothetical protein